LVSWSLLFIQSRLWTASTFTSNWHSRENYTSFELRSVCWKTQPKFSSMIIGIRRSWRRTIWKAEIEVISYMLMILAICCGAGWSGSLGTCPQLWAYLCCLPEQVLRLPNKYKWDRHIQQYGLHSTCACSYWYSRIHSWSNFNSSKS
jgi:hypothetical protein